MTIFASFPQQTFNDALFCIEKAKALDPLKQPFESWKYCAWSIVSSVLCMESYLKGYIIGSLKDETKKNKFRKNTPNFEGKIKFLQNEFHSKIPDYDSSSFVKIRDAIKLRNDIVHFNRDNIFNDLNVKNAEETIEACRELIRKILSGKGLDYKIHAKWVDKTQSEMYDKPKS